MSANLDAFLTIASAPGIGAVWVPIDRATTWLLENSKSVSFVQAEASDYGLLCKSAEKEIGGKTFHYLKFERAKTWRPTINIPHLSATKTELSR